MTRKAFEITVARLHADGACSAHVEIVERAFGTGPIKCTARNLARAAQAGADINWLTRYLPPQAEAAYRVARAQARAAFEAAMAPARAAFEAAMAPAWAAYQAATAPARAAFEAAMAPAHEAYQAATAPAWAAYQATLASALATALRDSVE